MIRKLRHETKSKMIYILIFLITHIFIYNYKLCSLKTKSEANALNHYIGHTYFATAESNSLINTNVTTSYFYKVLHYKFF